MTSIRLFAAALLLTTAACSHLQVTQTSRSDQDSARAQLSVGYSLLYEEAEGIPKLKWLLMFKDKPEEMGRMTAELTRYYQALADSMRKMSQQFPAMRLDMTTMPRIEAHTRKAIGTDLAKDFAPVVGKSGVAFEREALLMFYNGLNEQRHLVGIMVGMEPDPTLKKFLESTKTELEEHHRQVGALLDRRYFVH